MTIRISLSTVLFALAFAAIGAGSAVGVMLWEPWDGERMVRAIKGAEGKRQMLRGPVV